MLRCLVCFQEREDNEYTLHKLEEYSNSYSPPERALYSHEQNSEKPCATRELSPHKNRESLQIYCRKRPTDSV